MSRQAPTRLPTLVSSAGKKEAVPEGTASVNLEPSFLALGAFLSLLFVFGFFAADGARPAAAFSKSGGSKGSHRNGCNGNGKEFLHHKSYDSHKPADVQSFSEGLAPSCLGRDGWP
jgi:hypothetical protein